MGKEIMLCYFISQIHRNVDSSHNVVNNGNVYNNMSSLDALNDPYGRGGDYFEVSQTQAFLVVVWYCIQEYVIIFDKKISLTPPPRGLKFLI